MQNFITLKIIFKLFFCTSFLTVQATEKYPIDSCYLVADIKGNTKQDVLRDHQQLLVVISQDWNTVQACLQRFERSKENESWILIGEPIPVVLGKSGLAWGIGLQSFPMNRTVPLKKEGDLKAPAGLFSIGTVFGFFPNSEMQPLNMDYLQIHAATEAVDDTVSRYYNQIVNGNEVECDWQSSEKMAEISLYQLGFVIEHNYPLVQPGRGSAIFFHIWRHEKAGTAGCTAMDYENLNEVVYWLEKDKNPALIQLPKALYKELQETWSLPIFQI